MFNFDFLLKDRIDKIQAINKQYDIEQNAYISFSGGKDSTILHFLVDMALPNNKIPRVFINTGIEYLDILRFVKELQKSDDRIVILNSGVVITEMLNKYGYPFKSKQHSHNLDLYWHHKGEEYNLSLKRYLGIIESNTKFRCPKKLEYQFKPNFNIHCSDKCCLKLKKEPVKKWAIQNNKTIVMTGMRKAEGGQRMPINCIITNKDNKLEKFHPLLVIDDNFENEFIKQFNIPICKLYKPPYLFKRTGCKGCPFSLDLQKQLDVMEKLLPNEKRQCEFLFKPVYEEYRRIGYRLRNDKQLRFLKEEI